MPEQDTAFDLDEILARVAAETREMLCSTTDLERGYQEVVAPRLRRPRRDSGRRRPRRPPTKTAPEGWPDNPPENSSDDDAGQRTWRARRSMRTTRDTEPMTTQPDTELTRQVLQVAAQATQPIGRFDIACAVDPGAEDLQEGTPEHEAFLRRRIEIIRAAVEAEQAGLLDCVRPAGDDGGDLLQLSERGRERLQRHG